MERIKLGIETLKQELDELIITYGIGHEKVFEKNKEVNSLIVELHELQMVDIRIENEILKNV